MMLLEHRFVIPQVEMTGCTAHEKLHHPFRFRGMMQYAAQDTRCRIGLERVSGQHRGEGNSSQSASGLPEEVAPCELP